MGHKIQRMVAYNPMTEERLDFKNQKELALHFGISPKTISYWITKGRPIIDLMEDERGIIDITRATQEPLRGFEIYTEKEWQE